MKKVKKLIALTTAMALCASQVQGQEYDGAYDGTVNDDSAAYYDSGRASYWSAAIPIGAIIVAAIIIATNRHHHHHHGSGDGGGRSRSSRSSRSSSSISHQ